MAYLMTPLAIKRTINGNPVTCVIQEEYIRLFRFTGDGSLHSIFRVEPDDVDTINFFKDTKDKIFAMNFVTMSAQNISGMFLMEDIKIEEGIDIPFINISVEMQYKP